MSSGEIGSNRQQMLLRYVLFVSLSMLILALNAYLYAPRERPKPSGVQEGGPGSTADLTHRDSQSVVAEAIKAREGMDSGRIAGPPAEPKRVEPEGASEPGGESMPDRPERGLQVGSEPELPLRYLTLGSMDPQSRFRMLVTLTTRGAAVVRIELNDPRYRDAEIRSGYLGELVASGEASWEKCVVEVVGPGTPAALAGMKPGDCILGIDGQPVGNWDQLWRYLRSTRPGQQVRLTIQRGNERHEIPVRLGQKPVEVIRPEGQDPLSFLFTIGGINGSRLEDVRRRIGVFQEAVQQLRRRIVREDLGEKELGEIARQLQEMHQEFARLLGRSPEEEIRWHFSSSAAARAALETFAEQVNSVDILSLELPGVSLRRANWEVLEATESRVVFGRRLPAHQLEVRKVYELAAVAPGEERSRSFPAYHLTLRLEVLNLSPEERRVGYQLDGPTGLPTEGRWYAVKVGPGWGAYGLRDVAVAWHGGRWDLISCWRIAEDKLPLWREEGGQSLRYLGVDAQYFSVVLLPQKSDPKAEWFFVAQPLRVGPVREDWKSLTNTSCRLVTVEFPLAGHGELIHEYQIFAGPKRPALLSHYGLRELVVYGWFWWVAIPMLWILHFLHDYLVFNYGLAIIMLTVIVRLAMFPLSKKQALAAQKMQQIQPELKLIYERYKNDPQQRLRAQQELFRKYNYNPLGGCLILLLQLPIFIGLYRALMVDVELRASPLISSAIRWCSDLSAPDMLFDWSGFWAAIGWHWFNEGHGLFALGPYFNILPILTVALFIWQQKMLSPPPADEQAAIQQQVMTFMLVFMGILFYKVASGLCIYFIASSLWGLAERQLLPRLVPATEEKAPSSESPKEKKGEGWLERLRSRLEAMAESSGQKRPPRQAGERPRAKSLTLHKRKRSRK
jgi:YidC/Oxa1 family membrane protein insertase